MDISIQREAAWLGSLDPAKRARFLSEASHELTVAIRLLCHFHSDPARGLSVVNELNEAHHRVAAYLMHHHKGDEDTGWIRSVAASMLDCEDAAASKVLQQTWLYSRQVLQPPESHEPVVAPR